MISSEQQAEVVYKVLEGKANTNANRSAAEEPLPSALILNPANIWLDAGLIPQTAPALTSGGIFSVTFAHGVIQDVLQYFVDELLTAVSASSFYSPNLKDSISYSFDPAGTYLYTLKDSGNTLAFGLNSWVVDNEAGTLTFYDGIPPGISQPPQFTLTFYKYVGRKSLQGVIQANGSVQMDPSYVPTLPQDVVTQSALDASLNKLKPPAPPILSASPLILSGAYSAFEAGTRTTDTNCIGNASPTIAPSNAFLDDSNGTASLVAYIDGTAVGTLAIPPITTPEQAGALTIISDVDPYNGITGQQGFYTVISASITPVSPLSVAAHSAQLDLAAETTPVLNFHVDDPQAPSVSGISITPPISTSRYVSGVPSLSVGDAVSISFTIGNAVRSHYGTNIAQITSAHLQGAAYATPGSPISGANISLTEASQALANVYSESITIGIAGLNSRQLPGPTTTVTPSIRIDTFSNEVRVTSGTGLSPTAYGGVFDPSQSIASVTSNEELQLLNGLYQWPTGNYTSNLPIAGPDYSSVAVPADGNRWVTFKLGSQGSPFFTNANGFDLEINNPQGSWTTNGSNSTTGVRIEARVVTQSGSTLTPVTAWIDCNSPYPGVGLPGSSPSRQLDPAMVAGDVNTSAVSKHVTFGPTVYSGILIIRIGLTPTSGLKFASISVQSN
jgi:hypothetical protein